MGKKHWETKELRPGSAAPHLRAEAERLCGTRSMPWCGMDGGGSHSSIQNGIWDMESTLVPYLRIENAKRLRFLAHNQS
jgi:hypothetical protein